MGNSCPGERAELARDVDDMLQHRGKPSGDDEKELIDKVTSQIKGGEDKGKNQNRDEDARKK